MTVRDWVMARSPQPPEALRQGVMAALGADADADVSQTTAACMNAAGRSLQALLAEQRFGRDGALELLAVDALATYAYEHASDPEGSEDLEAAAEYGVHLIGQLVAPRG